MASDRCEFCSGREKHERWCSVVNENVNYAWAAVADARNLTVEDVLLLHSWGVIWPQVQKLRPPESGG